MPPAWICSAATTFGTPWVPRRSLCRPLALSRVAAIVDGEVKQVSLEDYKGKYVILFFYPKDFT